MTPFRWWCQQNKLSPQWDYLIKFLSLDLANWSIYMETEESVVQNGHFPWHCLKFHDVFHQFCQMSKFPWHSVKFPDNSLTLRNFISPWHFPDGYEPCRGWKLQTRYINIENSIWKLSIAMVISIHINYIDDLRQHYQLHLHSWLNT